MLPEADVALPSDASVRKDTHFRSHPNDVIDRERDAVG